MPPPHHRRRPTRSTLLIGWLNDGSLLAFERNKVPSKVRRFDLRTRTVTPYSTLAPPDITGSRH